MRPLTTLLLISLSLAIFFIGLIFGAPMKISHMQDITFPFSICCMVGSCLFSCVPSSNTKSRRYNSLLFLGSVVFFAIGIILGTCVSQGAALPLLVCAVVGSCLLVYTLHANLKNSKHTH